jgi:hypothetical protein
MTWLKGKVGEPLPVFDVLIYSRTTFDTEERARDVVSYLLSRPLFVPDRFGEYEPYRRLTPERVEQAISLVMNQAGQKLDPERVWTSVGFERMRPPRCFYIVSWAMLPHRAFEISNYTIEEDFVRKPDHLTEWLEFTFGLLHLHEAWYAQFALNIESLQKNFLTWRTQHPRAKDPQKGVEGARGVGVELEKGIPGVYWGNYFGPFYVEWFGREKFETLPCMEKRWLDTGGIFFTTAPTPFEWDTPTARQLQQAVKDHLGADAFFDIATVRGLIRELEPIPETMAPEQFQPPRRVPEFPFTVEPPRSTSVEEEIEEARRYFEGQGYTLVGVEGRTVTFHDGKGGIVRVTVGPGGTVAYQPKV